MKGPQRELNDVLPIVLKPQWERNEIAFLGTSFAFRRGDRFLTAAHCVTRTPPRDLLLVDLDEPMETLEVEHAEFHPTADVAVLFVRPRYRERVDFFYDTHRQFVPGESFTAFGYPAELSGQTHDFPTGRLFRGHFQRFHRHRTAWNNVLTQTPYEFIAGEMSISAPRGLSGGPVVGREPHMVLGLVTENLEAYTERRTRVDTTAADGTRYIEVESAVVTYGVALLLEHVREWLDVHAPRLLRE